MRVLFTTDETEARKVAQKWASFWQARIDLVEGRGGWTVEGRGFRPGGLVQVCYLNGTERTLWQGTDPHYSGPLFEIIRDKPETGWYACLLQAYLDLRPGLYVLATGGQYLATVRVLPHPGGLVWTERPHKGTPIVRVLR